MKTIRKYILFTILMVASFAVSAQTTDDSNNTNETKNSSMRDPNKFSHIGVHYTAPFKWADMGSYGIDWILYGSGGFGVEYGFGWNFGLIDIEYASTVMRLGIAYGAVISDNALLSTSLCLEMVPYFVDDKMKAYFGASLNPQLVFKVGNIRPHAGLSFNGFGKSDKISVGFIIGIGIYLN